MPSSKRKSKSLSSRNTTLSAASSHTSLRQSQSKSKTSKKKKRSRRDASEGSFLDSAADSDYDLWEPSSSPAEDWDAYSNPNSDDEWLVESIVSEEVTINGMVSYEVKWGGNWHRPDGTSTTWQREIDGDNNIKSRWTREQAKERERLARETLDVNVTKLTSAYAHDYRTQEWNEAVWEKYFRAEEEEKKRIAANGGISTVDWDGEVQRHKGELYRQINRNRDRDRESLINRSRGGRGAAISRIHTVRERQREQERMERRDRINKRKRTSPSIESIAPQSDAAEGNSEREDEDEADDQMLVDAREGQPELQPARGVHEEIRSRLRLRPSTTSNSLLRKTRGTPSQRTVRERSLSLGCQDNVMAVAGLYDRQNDELGRHGSSAQVTVKREDDERSTGLVAGSSSTSHIQKGYVTRHTAKKMKREPSAIMVCVDVPPRPDLSRPLKMQRSAASISSSVSTRSQDAVSSLGLGNLRLRDSGSQATSKHSTNTSSVTSISAPSSSRTQQGTPTDNQYEGSLYLSPDQKPSSTKLPRTRANLESQWNGNASAARAKPIRIINDLSDDENGNGRKQFPPVCDDFVYLENQYIYTKETDPRNTTDFLIGCKCMKCDDPSRCLCQESSEVKDAEGRKLLSYDRRGRFLFNNEGSEVIECNRKCRCSLTCRNRVAQRPRDIAIEIFKTRRNGWGARATEPLPKGKVLGLYTGEIMRREDANKFAKGEKNFIFNLDTRDADLDAPEYSINAEFAGNWTRFINHSCEPVASVYPVVIENPLELNVPCLAVVARVDIPARTEITIDYSPHEPQGIAGLVNGRGGVGWIQVPIPDDREQCFCGSDHCRGFI